MSTAGRQNKPFYEQNLSKTSGGKRASGAKRGKKYNQHQAQENIRPVPSAGKHKLVSGAGKDEPDRIRSLKILKNHC